MGNDWPFIIFAAPNYDSSQKVSQTEFVQEFNDLFSSYPYVSVTKNDGFEFIDTGKIEYGIYHSNWDDDTYLYIFGKESTVEICFTDTASTTKFNAKSAEGRSRFKREFSQVMTTAIQRNRWKLNVNDVLPAVLK